MADPWPPICERCKAPLTEPGGLAFSPPTGQVVVKVHICRLCWEALRRWITQEGNRGADPRCPAILSRRPEWMSPDQYDPCRCRRATGHEGEHYFTPDHMGEPAPDDIVWPPPQEDDRGR